MIDFDETYRDNRHLVFRVCRKWTKNDADAEELTQDTFLWAIRYQRFFEKFDGSLAAWLCLAAKQMCYRWSKNYSTQVSNASDGMDVLFEVRSHGGDPLKAIAVKEVLAKMPKKIREASILYGSGRSMQEIGEIHGTSQMQVFRMIEQARGRLQPLCN